MAAQPVIAVGGIMHESNTFSPTPTDLSLFRVQRGQEIIARWGAARHEMSGFITGAEQFSFTLYPTLMAGAIPAGTVTAYAFETLVSELLDSLKNGPPLDGMLLALHGAMVSENYPDADGEIVRRVRETLGPDMPLVVTHDYHANISQQMIDHSNALVIYKTNPHIDQPRCGSHAAEILSRVIKGEVRPVQVIVKPPLLLNIIHHNTSAEPMSSIMEAAREVEQQPGILAANVAAGFQYADVEEMGPSVVVVVDGDEALAQRETERLAAMVWDAREQMAFKLPDAADGVRMALESEQMPVVLVETGDNIGGGSAGDATFILVELLRQNADGWLVVMSDPEAVTACTQAGIGATVTLNIGGKRDNLHGEPVSVTGRVKVLHDGKYIETETRHGGERYRDQGLTAVLEMPHDTPESANVIVLTSLREPPFSLNQLLSLGVQPQLKRIIVVKAAVAFRAAYQPIAGRIIEVDTPGLTAVNPARFNYRHVRRPLWGLDDINV